MSNLVRLLRVKIGAVWIQTALRVLSTPRYRLIWEALALVGLLPLLYYILRLWYHGLGYDPDFLSFTAEVATLLALVSLLGFQSEWGQLLAKRLGQMVNLSRWLQNSFIVALTIWLSVGLLAIGFHWGYPWLTTSYYNPRGVTALEQGRYSAAVQDFRQAITLSPDKASGYYNLANAYEFLYEYEQAISEYQFALELDDELWPAYNNLGRLYLVARNEPDAALTILLAGETRADNALQKAVLGKNIASAYLEKGWLATAQSKLEEVEGLFSEVRAQGVNVSIYLAESYRLMALTHKALNQPEEAKRAWASSQGHALAVRDAKYCQPPIRLSEIDCLNAQIWAAEAKEQLNLLQGDE